jgi:hypothetical protein
MKAYAPLVLVGCALLPACTDNIRQAPAAQIAQQTEHSPSPDPQGLTWFAPVLHLSQYREGVQEAKRKWSGVRRPPRSRRGRAC